MDKATATDIGLPTFEPRVACGGYCYGGVVKMDPTDLPQYTAAEDVWVKGDAVAAELAALRAERDQLLGESARLRAERNLACQVSGQQGDENEALRARVATLQVGHDRYEWLRCQNLATVNVLWRQALIGDNRFDDLVDELRASASAGGGRDG